MPNSMVDARPAKIMDIILSDLHLKVDSSTVPTTVQHTTSSAIEVGKVCENTFNMTIGFRDTGFWIVNNVNPIKPAITATTMSLLTDG